MRIHPMIKLGDHLFPRTVEEAVEMLDSFGGRGRILAGGTDLVEKLREGNPDVDVFVDVGRIEGFRTITREENGIVLGGGVTHAQAGACDAIKKDATVLAEASLSVGGPQIRNLGTLAGNIISAQPAADGSLALVALGAMLTVVGPGYERKVNIAEAFADVGVSTIDATKELITEIIVPVSGGRSGSNYQRLAIRRSLALPMVAAAAAVTLVDGAFKSASLAVGPMAPVPLLVTSVDELLQNKSASRENILKAAEKVAHAANPRDSRLRGSKEYRLSMAKVLAFKAIITASVRAHEREE